MKTRCRFNDRFYVSFWNNCFHGPKNGGFRSFHRLRHIHLQIPRSWFWVKHGVGGNLVCRKMLRLENQPAKLDGRATAAQQSELLLSFFHQKHLYCYDIICCQFLQGLKSDSDITWEAHRDFPCQTLRMLRRLSQHPLQLESMMLFLVIRNAQVSSIRVQASKVYDDLATR